MMDLFEIENDKSSLSKILTRRSSVGCSSRISYYRTGEGVPFKWEMQPGIAKESPKEELPPLTPPPAILSLGLPKPCIDLDPEPSTKLRLRFWKKRMKRGKNKKQQGCFHEDVVGFDILSRLDCNSESESMVSPRGSSFSSSSSSSSSLSLIKSRGPSLQSACSECTTKQGCFPVLVSIARRSD